MRVRNVTLHQRGNKVNGTLTLDKFHLIFSFPVDGAKDPAARRDSPRHSKTPSQNESGPPPERSSDDATTEDGVTKSSTPQPSSAGKNGSQRPRPKTKTIWIGYPMINSCTLRPSHTRPYTTTGQSTGDDTKNWLNGDEGFPPTFGTSGYGRPSADSARLGPYSSPLRPASPALPTSEDSSSLVESGRSPALRIRCRDFQMMAFHFHPAGDGRSPDEVARDVFYALRERCCVAKVEDMLAFSFQPPAEERAIDVPVYDARREFARMGIGGKAPEGPGSAWRVSEINRHYEFSATYPSLIAVPRAVSDNIVKHGGHFRSRSRIPALAYLHFNGGSITRSSQPLVGLQGKRSPQDERLVSAIFSSHTPPLEPYDDSVAQPPGFTSQSSKATTSVDSDDGPANLDGVALHTSRSEPALDDIAAEASTTPKQKVYGSTRHNLIVDARPRINAIANKTTGGGFEDVSHYNNTLDIPVQRVFLSIQNIHIMRASLKTLVESFESTDYTTLAPDQELLRKSGWLGHIATLLDGAELVARAVGLTGSHVLIHCSDGWDRTSQVSALAQIMLDPHYRTLDGFITLVQKDFLSFGHKFRDRNGIQGCEKWFEIENERIPPSRSRETAGSEGNSLNAIGAKALSGAKNWFEKNRANLFKTSASDLQPSETSSSSSRPASPPPNPLVHSAPTASAKEEGKDRHTDEKEIAPIFHQFLDACFQLLRQYPAAFEYNELFLRRLLYQTYAGQYGEFLFNNEKEREAYKDKVPSVWMHFLSRRAEFTNPQFAPEERETLLLPRHERDGSIEVRWWHQLFRREDKEMNVPRALAPPDPPTVPFLTATQPSSLSLDDRAEEKTRDGAEKERGLREARSSPSLLEKRVDEDLAPRMSALSTVQEPKALRERPVENGAAAGASAHPPSKLQQMVQQETDYEVLNEQSTPVDGSEPELLEAPRPNEEFEVRGHGGGGDPLGVSDEVREVSGKGAMTG